MKTKDVYTVVESDGKKRFVRIGTAVVKDDGTIAIKLAALPVNGQLQIRDGS